MILESLREETASSQLLAVIATQTEIVKLGLDLAGVMSLVAERALNITGATGAVVELVEGDDMVYRAVAGEAAGLLGVRLARISSLSGLCVTTGTPLRCDDSEDDPRVDRDACRRVRLRSMIVVPLIHEGSAVGALKVFSPKPAAFVDGDVRVLGLMSELIAAAMFHAARYGADELFRQATTDALTGLANRALYLDRLRHAIAKVNRSRHGLGVLMIDMDGLKPINDRHGHRAGDAAIREIASRIAAHARQSDTVARFGGDEFAFLMVDVPDRHSALMIGERIGRACGMPFTFEGQALDLGVSIGAAMCPDDGDEPEPLLERADQAMYAAKRLKKATAAR